MAETGRPTKLFIFTFIVFLLLCGAACGGPTLCRGRLYRAAILTTATQGETQISLVAQPMIMPEGAVFDANSYPDMCVVEFMPDVNTPSTVTFEFLITFDPNMCVEPATTLVKFGPYVVIDTIPAPPVEVVPFEAVE